MILKDITIETPEPEGMGPSRIVFEFVDEDGKTHTEYLEYTTGTVTKRTIGARLSLFGGNLMFLPDN